jgi:phosphoadenosine phosphosulfate reductase
MVRLIVRKALRTGGSGPVRVTCRPRHGPTLSAVTSPTPAPLSIAPDAVERLGAEDLLLWAAEEFGEGLVLSCSWQKQSSVLAHMTWSLGLDAPVIELDTHLLFRETYQTRNALVDRYGLRLIQPEIVPIAEQHRTEGPNLWETEADRCCHIRKIEPLQRTLQTYRAWASGIRRTQSPSRANLQKLEWSDVFGVWKVHPLAAWTDDDVWAYIAINEIPYHPLHDVGYRSIGCIPCTRPIAPGEEERAGRWAGSDKIECGLHITAAPVETSTGA